MAGPVALLAEALALDALAALALADADFEALPPPFEQPASAAPPTAIAATALPIKNERLETYES